MQGPMALVPLVIPATACGIITTAHVTAVGPVTFTSLASFGTITTAHGMVYATNSGPTGLLPTAARAVGPGPVGLGPQLAASRRAVD